MGTCDFDCSSEDHDLTENISECPVYSVVWRRSFLKDNMIKSFKDKGILKKNVYVTLIGYHGKEEEGKGDCVFRDTLTSFWNQFFIALAVGSQEKIPSIRHDYQKSEWEAISRILLYGSVKDRYFPLSLSVGFFSVCLFGEDAVSTDFLQASFRHCLSEDKKEIFDNVSVKMSYRMKMVY